MMPDGERENIPRLPHFARRTVYGNRGSHEPLSKNFRRLGRSTGSGGGREKGVRSSEPYRYISVYVNKDAPRISRMRVTCKKARATEKRSCGRERIQ